MCQQLSKHNFYYAIKVQFYCRLFHSHCSQKQGCTSTAEKQCSIKLGKSRLKNVSTEDQKMMRNYITLTNTRNKSVTADKQLIVLLFILTYLQSILFITCTSDLCSYLNITVFKIYFGIQLIGFTFKSLIHFIIKMYIDR